MVQITIRLVGGSKEIIFERIEFDQKVHVHDLVKEIETLTKIRPNYQKIHFNGEKLPSSLQPLLNAKDFDEVVVEHIQLPRWIQYRNCVEHVKKRQANVADYAHSAVQQHKNLMECGFFDAYVEFDDYRLKHQPEVASWTDGVNDLMANTAKNHFLILHGQRGGASITDFKYDWYPRPNDLRGTRNGIIAHVQLHGEDRSTKYSIKSHHYGSTASSSKGSCPDIIELYSYKVLELLKVGPSVQFILPSEFTGSKTATYIASTWRDDFVRLSDVSDDELSIKALIQLRLLNVMFFIGDLHGDNCGQWKSTNNAAVVDLIPLPYRTFPDVRKAIRGPFKLAWNDGPRKLLVEYPQEKFWDFVRNCLYDWDALEKINQAKEIIAIQKNQIKKLFRGIDCESDYSVTNELDNHVDSIRANLEKLARELDSSH